MGRHDQAYAKLLSTRRRRKSAFDRSSKAEQLASDRSRVLFSAAFRRLQGKTQVFPLSGNASVRTRLTHSIEVADLGRSMATLLASRLQFESDLRSAFVDAVETGCLLHDIGNPPFGHFGEDAIKTWARDVLPKLAREAGAPDSDVLRDLQEFDGNAQGYRLLVRLQSDFDAYGLNLTYGQLGAVVKYPFTSEALDVTKFPQPKPAYASKPGIFSSDKELLADVWRELGLRTFRRSPLVYLVEAADDIAYGLSDIEDAIETRASSLEDVQRMLADSSSELVKELLTKANGDFVRFRVSVSKKMTSGAVGLFEQNHEAILGGRFASKSLVHASEELLGVRDALGKVARKAAYSSEAAELPEMAGLHTVSGLLGHLEPLLRLPEDTFKELRRGELRKKHPLEARLIARLPEKYLRAYSHMCNEDPDYEWWWRVHLLVDFVGGMTDGYAVKLFQILSGIKLS